MRQVVFASLLLPMGLVQAQTSPSRATQNLEKLYKVEFGLGLANAGAELPLNHNMLVDFSAGLGPRYEMTENLRISGGNDNTLFLRGEVRFYLNRGRREARGHSLRSNSGTFLAFQTKYLPLKDGSHNYQSPTNWMNELHFGQQLSLGRWFLFRYHFGVGMGVQTERNLTAVYPAIGLAVGFRINRPKV